MGTRHEENIFNDNNSSKLWNNTEAACFHLDVRFICNLKNSILVLKLSSHVGPSFCRLTISMFRSVKNRGGALFDLTATLGHDSGVIGIQKT